MREVIAHLNCLHVLVVAVVGFIFGCLWLHGPLFGKLWLAEMNLTNESMEAAIKKQGSAMFLIRGLILTFLGTFGLAALVATHAANWKHGAAFGAFVGFFVSGVRLLNGTHFEHSSAKLQAINLSNEVALFAIQGAILAAWH